MFGHREAAQSQGSDPFAELEPPQNQPRHSLLSGLALGLAAFGAAALPVDVDAAVPAAELEQELTQAQLKNMAERYSQMMCLTGEEEFLAEVEQNALSLEPFFIQIFEQGYPAVERDGIRRWGLDSFAREVESLGERVAHYSTEEGRQELVATGINPDTFVPYLEQRLEKLNTQGADAYADAYVRNWEQMYRDRALSGLQFTQSESGQTLLERLAAEEHSPFRESAAFLLELRAAIDAD